MLAPPGGLPHRYMDDLLQLETCKPRTAPLLPQRMRDPLYWREWDRLLERHPDQRFRSYVVDGIRMGFRVGFSHEYQ